MIHSYKKQILRHLDSNNIKHYLVPNQIKKALGYPQKNMGLSPESFQGQWEQLLCCCWQRIQSMQNEHGFQILMLNQKNEVVYQQIFKTEYEMKLNSGLFFGSLREQNIRYFSQEDKLDIERIIKHKIIVGHDLASFLTYLTINHHHFIDTLAFFPHYLALPNKNNIQIIARQYLKKYHRFINIKQRASIIMELVQLYIRQGRGLIVQTQAIIPQNHYTFDQLLREAELQKQRVLGFFLRGSRALGQQIQSESYMSDWDYFCVYKTKAVINGRLLKLYNTDITIYDQKTFYQLLNQNDIPCVQLFHLPPSAQLRNQLKPPIIELKLFRYSLDFHHAKSDRKIKRYFKFSDKKKLLTRDTLSDSLKEWKILKANHLKYRFMTYFVQLFERRKIYDILQSNSIWKCLVECYYQRGFKFCLQWIQKKVEQKYKQITQIYPSYSNNNKQSKYPQILNYYQQDSSIKQQQIIRKSNKRQQNIKIQKHTIHNIFQQIKKIQRSNHRIRFLTNLKILQQVHSQYPNLVQLNSQKYANFNFQLCRVCKGLILDENKNYSIVALPFSHIFQYNQKQYSKLDQFDLSSSKIYQQFIGLNVIFYHYNKQWHPSSTKTPDGKDLYSFVQNEPPKTLRQIFFLAFTELQYKIPDDEDQNLTFMFRLIWDNKSIKNCLIFYGVINRLTGEQYDIKKYGQKYRWNYQQQLRIKLNSIQQGVELAENMRQKQKGIILIDKNELKIKITNQNYKKGQWVQQLNREQEKQYLYLKIILGNRSSQFCQYFPQLASNIKDLQRKIDILKQRCRSAYKYVNRRRHMSGYLIQKQRRYIRPFLQYFQRGEGDKMETLVVPRLLFKYIKKIKLNNNCEI